MAATTSQCTLLKLYYLFMNADGVCTPEEEERFDEICKSFKATQADKKEAIDFVSKYQLEENNDNGSQVILIMEKLLDDHPYLSIGSSITGGIMGIFFGDNDKITYAHTLWTMISLGYADNDFAKSEQKVINYLKKRWEIDDTLYNTMVDTAETILSLVLKKDWAKTTNKPYSKTEELVKGIDEDIKKLYKDMEITISEANI